MTIGIIDYGLGNLASVAGAVKRLEYNVVVTNNHDELKRAEKLILPGVGAFGDGMAKLRDLGLIELLEDLVIRQKVPILGICLGCQLMARTSDEFGEHDGLGWFDAHTVRFQLDDLEIRIPHVGWNDLYKISDNILFDDIADNALFYYVHSHYVTAVGGAARDIIGECEYGVRFAAVMHRDNIYATQFHPEKSQKDGLTLLGNFLGKA